MHDLEWYDYLRMLTMLIALTALYFAGKRAITYWPSYTERLKSLWWAFSAWLFLAFEGSMEQIISNGPWGPRTLLTFIVTLVSLRAILQNQGFIRNEDDHENRNRKP